MRRLIHEAVCPVVQRFPEPSLTGWTTKSFLSRWHLDFPWLSTDESLSDPESRAVKQWMCRLCVYLPLYSQSVSKPCHISPLTNGTRTSIFFCLCFSTCYGEAWSNFWRFPAGHLVVPGVLTALQWFVIINKRRYCIHCLLRRENGTSLPFFHSCIPFTPNKNCNRRHERARG